MPQTPHLNLHDDNLEPGSYHYGILNLMIITKISIHYSLSWISINIIRHTCWYNLMHFVYTHIFTLFRPCSALFWVPNQSARWTLIIWKVQHVRTEHPKKGGKIAIFVDLICVDLGLVRKTYLFAQSCCSIFEKWLKIVAAMGICSWITMGI